MQEELEQKSKLLNAAKQSLRAAEKATAPRPLQSPRPIASASGSDQQQQQQHNPNDFYSLV
jgi:hypothetical protein